MLHKSYASNLQLKFISTYIERIVVSLFQESDSHYPGGYKVYQGFFTLTVTLSLMLLNSFCTTYMETPKKEQMKNLMVICSLNMYVYRRYISVSASKGGLCAGH